uniref:Interferon alpha inducible protein 6 n=1 Tax=Microcebus murinus TaxID=30608 RepID=A0A8B7FEF2_MICMU|nr:interferon alpha-inducible protein 6 [Microcebus murinus]
MRQKAVSLFLCYLLLFTCVGGEAGGREGESAEDSGWGPSWRTLTYMAVGGGLGAAALPALGFTGAGIAAHSAAAWLMSWSAILNGGGVPAGGLVAMLQSLGASGGGSVLMGKVGAFLGYSAHKYMESKKKDEE